VSAARSTSVVFQHSLEGFSGDVAGRKGAAKRLRRLAAHRGDGRGLQRRAVEPTPGHRVGAAPLDPFFAKIGFASGEELQVRPHSCAIMAHEPLEPAIVVAMPVAQNQAIEPTRVEIEQFEVADQHLRRIPEVQQVPRLATGMRRFQMQGQAPLAGEG
jgi:hypothetical protein